MYQLQQILKCGHLNISHLEMTIETSFYSKFWCMCNILWYIINTMLCMFKYLVMYCNIFRYMFSITCDLCSIILCCLIEKPLMYRFYNDVIMFFESKNNFIGWQYRKHPVINASWEHWRQCSYILKTKHSKWRIRRYESQIKGIITPFIRCNNAKKA